MSHVIVEKPPQGPPSFASDPSQLLEGIKVANAQFEKVLDDIAANVKVEDATFENVLRPIIAADDVWYNIARQLKLPSITSPDKALRDAAREVGKSMRRFESECHMREDVFVLVDAVLKRAEKLSPESQHYLEKKHRAYIQNGLGIADKAKREQFKTVQGRMRDLQAELSKNVSESSAGIWFSPDELKGLAPAKLASFEQGEGDNAGKVYLTFKRPDLFAALTFADIEATRRAMWIGSENKCPENVPLIRDLFHSRDEAARLLGYANHAALRISDKMMQTPDAVHDFLKDLHERSTPGGRAELEELTQLKREDIIAQGAGDDEGANAKVYLWDFMYYSAKLKAKKVSLDAKLLQEYMPLEPALKGMFNIYERLFGTRFIPLRFDETKGSLVDQHLTWHANVRVFEVWDADATNTFLGYLYLEMHPRPGLHTHPGHYRLHRAYTLPTGSRSPVSSVLITNFSPPLPNKPSLLTHQEMVSCFHELGHAIHALVSTCTIGADNLCVEDFVEIPSKMLENWFWLPEVLRTVCGHYSYMSDEYKEAWEAEQREKIGGLQQGGGGGKEIAVEQPPREIPEELLQAVVGSRFVGGHLAELRQLHLAMFDMAVHGPESREEALRMDFAVVWNRLRTEVMLVPGPEDEDEEVGYHWGNGHARFGHMFGYAGAKDAGYYGYLIAGAYAADLYASAFQDDPMSAAAGRRYRRAILAPGASVPEMQMLERFLGRKPNADAYYKLTGLA